MIDNRERSDKDLTFSQRNDYKSMPEPMRLEEISDDLRREIWNETRRFLISISFGNVTYSVFESDETRFIERVLGRLLNKPEDEINTRYDRVLYIFKEIIQESSFYNVLDVVELILHEKYQLATAQKLAAAQNKFSAEIRRSFERHTAAYWLDTSSFPPRFFPRSTRMQGEATRSAIETIRDGGMKGAETHLRQAAENVNARQFANSITDSIHAVESVARTIDPEAKTLGPALDSLQRSGVLKHPALKEAFSKLYGYTNDEQGIRHPLLDKDSPDVDLDDAMFMFGACASFAAYLVNKHRKAEQGKSGGP